MTELEAILKTWRSLRNEHRNAVLATVVHTAGSVYRRAGARLLLVPDGRRIGCVSGGCLEGEIGKKAWWWTEAHHASLQVFDTTGDEDTIWGFGLGCNGVVQVLIERANAKSTVQLLEFLEATQLSRETAAVATIVRSSPEAEFRVGQRLLVMREEVTGELAACYRAKDFTAWTSAVLRKRSSEFVHLDCADLFIEYVPPTRSLVVLGAGYDAQPLVTIAKEVGFHVTVADPRAAYLRPEYFPDADKTVLLTDDDVLRHVQVDSEVAVVLMTHSFQLDARLLPRILAARPRYLGLLGPRTRAEQLFADLDIGMPPWVHAPVGLDIGGDSPTAVALSVVAEIQAVFEGRSGNMLKYRRGAIHKATVLEAGETDSGLRPKTVHSSICDSHRCSNA
jgi:xanthine dehydrogenase accessory factor